MKRGDLYRVRHPSNDPKRSRVYVVVSRQALIDTRFSSVVCAPVFTRRGGISTQVDVGINEGLKHDSCIECDALMSIQKEKLTDYIGSLSSALLRQVDEAVRIALDVECPPV